MHCIAKGASDMEGERRLVKQGAEAKVYMTLWEGKVAIKKERFAKTWRHETLDKKLRKQRLKQEVNCLERASAHGIPVPSVYHVDKKNCVLYMEYIPGHTLRKVLDEKAWDRPKSTPRRPPHHKTGFEPAYVIIGIEKFKQLGMLLANLHDIDLIHEDLTTSNILVRPDLDELVLIDFGLGHVSLSDEDRAVDLYVLERAFLGTHPNLADDFDTVIHAYAEASKRGKQMMKKLSEESNIPLPIIMDQDDRTMMDCVLLHVPATSCKQETMIEIVRDPASSTLT